MSSSTSGLQVNSSSLARVRTWATLTRNPLTSCYLFLAFAHFTAQLFLSVTSLSVNKDAADILADTLHDANYTTDRYIKVTSNNATFMACDSLNGPCQIIYDTNITMSSVMVFNAPGVIMDMMVPAINTAIDPKTMEMRRNIHLKENYDQDGSFVSISLVDSATSNVAAPHLHGQCVAILLWPYQILRNDVREEATIIFFQIWLLCISIIGLLRNSSPVIATVLFAHIIETAWAGVHLMTSARFKSTFKALVAQSTCEGLDVLPNLWKKRSQTEIPSLALNILVLVVLCIICWMILRNNKIHRIAPVQPHHTSARATSAAIMLVLLNLAIFYHFAGLALWIDQLYEGAIADKIPRASTYKIISLTALPISAVWILLGFYGSRWPHLRNRRRVLMGVHVVLSAFLLGIWAAMFAEIGFRLSLDAWGFLALITAFSIVITLCILITGFVCIFTLSSDIPAGPPNSLAFPTTGDPNAGTEDPEKAFHSRNESNATSVTNPTLYHRENGSLRRGEGQGERRELKKAVKESISALRQLEELNRLNKRRAAERISEEGPDDISVRSWGALKDMQVKERQAGVL